MSSYSAFPEAVNEPFPSSPFSCMISRFPGASSYSQSTYVDKVLGTNQHSRAEEASGILRNAMADWAQEKTSASGYATDTITLPDNIKKHAAYMADYLASMAKDMADYTEVSVPHMSTWQRPFGVGLDQKRLVEALTKTVARSAGSHNRSGSERRSEQHSENETAADAGRDSRASTWRRSLAIKLHRGKLFGTVEGTMQRDVIAESRDEGEGQCGAGGEGDIEHGTPAGGKCDPEVVSDGSAEGGPSDIDTETETLKTMARTFGDALDVAYRGLSQIFDGAQLKYRGDSLSVVCQTATACALIARFAGEVASQAEGLLVGLLERSERDLNSIPMAIVTDTGEGRVVEIDEASSRIGG